MTTTPLTLNDTWQLIGTTQTLIQSQAERKVFINVATGNSQGTTTCTPSVSSNNLILTFAYTGGIGGNISVYATAEILAI